MIIFFLLHFYKLTLPPNGYHHWRESDTAAVSLNYYQEDMNFLHPRINQRGDGPGITGSEFPIYNYVGALLYKIFGPSHLVHRLLSLFAGLLGIWLLYKAVWILTKEKLLGALSGFALSCSPLYFFYSYKIMPDIWMLMFLLASVLFYFRFLDNFKLTNWLFSTLFLILSATIKPLSLSIYLPFLVLTISRSNEKVKSFLRFVIYTLITFVPALLWYLYARYVNDIYQTPGYYLGGMLGDFYKFLATSQFYKKLFLQWPFEIWIGWPMVFFFAVGLYCYLKEKRKFAYASWLLAPYGAFLFISYHSSSHDYYTLIATVPFALVTGYGLWKAVQTKYGKQIMIACFVIVPLLTFFRVQHRIADVPEFEPMRTDTEKIIPRESLVMVEDGTTAIKLYQLNRVGWPLRGEIRPSDVQNLIARGGKYIILENAISAYDDSLAVLFEDDFRMIDSLYCYKAK